tara:strand:+ start:481 stop:807 length:327 start_codon:yes stop_codon:yes gene_type:complete
MERSKVVLAKHPEAAFAMINKAALPAHTDPEEELAKNIMCSLCCSPSVEAWGMKYIMKSGMKCSVCHTDLGSILTKINAKKGDCGSHSAWIDFVSATPKQELYKMFCL